MAARGSSFGNGDEQPLHEVDTRVVYCNGDMRVFSHRREIVGEGFQNEDEECWKLTAVNSWRAPALLAGRDLDVAGGVYFGDNYLIVM